jgi:peroxiredoxin
MVTCDRCHHKFSSYDALLQHYKTKHTNVTNLSQIEKEVMSEKETKIVVRTEMQHHGSSRARLGIFLIIIVIAVGVSGYVAFTPREAVASNIGIGSVAPNFTIQDTSGGTFTLSYYRGKSNVLLLFNEGLSCQPCLQQMHDLDALNGQLTAMNVLMVSVTPDTVDQLRNWMAYGAGQQQGKVLSDPSLAAFNLYHPVGTGGSMMTHTFILVNKSGMVIWRQDYGPSSMYVQNTVVLAAVTKALGT